MNFGTDITIGSVVRIGIRPRRYVVTGYCDIDRSVNLRALSGAIPGSGPNVVIALVCKDEDQRVDFTGAAAGKLRRAAVASLSGVGLMTASAGLVSRERVAAVALQCGTEIVVLPHG